MQKLNPTIWGDFDPQNLIMRGRGNFVPKPDNAFDLASLDSKQLTALLKGTFDLDAIAVEALAGVANQKLRLVIEKWLAAKLEEEARLATLSRYEEQLWQQGVQYVAGLDEVGRGPIAGPVVAAAVILPKGFQLFGVNDSKKLSETKRLQLEKQIKANAVAWAIGAVGVLEIDRYNILEASKMAMLKAVRILPVPAQHLLIDAVELAVPLPQTSIIQGDAKSASIGAASILAKCHRDRLMVVYDKLYPQYGLAKHKGYPTPAHKKAVWEFGYSAIHRQTFVLKPPKQGK